MKDGKYQILCIDDDQDILAVLTMVLEGAGYDVLTAPDGDAGFKLFKAEGPDLVIVDLMMEEIDAGTNFVKELRASGNDVPIYILSSLGQHLQLSADHTELGVSGILQKPIRPDTLLQLVASKLK